MAIIEMKTNSQLTIPREVIESVGLKKGDSLLVIAEYGKIRFVPRFDDGTERKRASRKSTTDNDIGEDFTINLPKRIVKALGINKGDLYKTKEESGVLTFVPVQLDGRAETFRELSGAQVDDRTQNRKTFLERVLGNAGEAGISILYFLATTARAENENEEDIEDDWLEDFILQELQNNYYYSDVSECDNESSFR